MPYWMGWMPGTAPNLVGEALPGWNVLAGVGSTGLAGADVVVLAAYLTGLFLLGAWFARRERSTADYYLAGGRLRAWSAGLSLLGTTVSAVTVIGITGIVYASDWSYFVAVLTPLALVPLVRRYYIPFYRRLGVRTAYEYLERRFSLPVRLTAGAMFVLYRLAMTGVVLYVPALALGEMTGLSVYLWLGIMGGLATGYTVLGGFEAVVWTDVLQVVVVLGGAVLCIAVAVGGVEEGLSAVVRQGMDAGKFSLGRWSWDPRAQSIWVIGLGYMVMQLLPLTAEQTTVQRYLAVRDERAAGRALWIGMLVYVPTSLLFYFLGTSLWVYIQADPARAVELAQAGDGVLPWFIMHALPPGVTGLVLAGVVAAAMSSADSGLSAVGSAIQNDFLDRLGRGRGWGQSLGAARGLTVLLGAIAVGLGAVAVGLGGTSVVNLFVTILGYFSGGLAGVFVLGLFTRRVGSAAALAGLAASGAGVWLTRAHVNFFLYGVVSLGACLLVGGAVALVCPGPAPADGLTVSAKKSG